MKFYSTKTSLFEILRPDFSDNTADRWSVCNTVWYYNGDKQTAWARVLSNVSNRKAWWHEEIVPSYKRGTPSVYLSIICYYCTMTPHSSVYLGDTGSGDEGVGVSVLADIWRVSSQWNITAVTLSRDQTGRQGDVQLNSETGGTTWSLFLQSSLKL